MLEAVEVGPVGDCRGSVIWLHGLGADGHDFESVVPIIGLDDVRFIFPHAPQMPVTINAGMVMPAWFDVLSLGSDLGSRQVDEDGIRTAAGWINELIQREVERGVPMENIVLGGFSQGGALALFLGPRLEQTLAGIMVLSSFHVLAEEHVAEADSANAKTPMLFCHGLYDPLVPYALGKSAYEKMVDEGRPADFHRYEMAHEVCLPELNVIADWLGQVLPESDY